MTSASDIDTEVLVVGGGIAGSVAAVGFATEGFTTSLLDTSAPDAPDREYALRVSSINLNSEKILRDMGIWPLIEQGRISPFERIMVWDDGHEDPLCFDAADVGLGHLAHIVENDLVAWAAHSRLGELSAFQPVDPGRVSEVGRRDGFVEVRTDAGKVHRCRLLVAADGASSSVRRLAGIFPSCGPSEVPCNRTSRLPSTGRRKLFDRMVP